MSVCVRESHAMLHRVYKKSLVKLATSHRDQQNFYRDQQNFFSIGHDEASRPMEFLPRPTQWKTFSRYFDFTMHFIEKKSSAAEATVMAIVEPAEKSCVMSSMGFGRVRK
jgi:hypothetical protein